MLISAIADIVQNSIGDRGGIMAKDDLVLYWVNEAILDIFRKTEVGREAETTAALSANGNTLDPVGKEILRVHYLHNGIYKMRESTKDGLLDRFGPDWFNETGVPAYYWRGYSAGHTIIMMAPKADAAYTLTYSATYVPTQFTLQSDNTSTLLPATFDTDIIRFCIMRAHELEKDFRASEKAQEHYNNNMFTRADETHELDDGYSTISPDEMDMYS